MLMFSHLGPFQVLPQTLEFCILQNEGIHVFLLLLWITWIQEMEWGG